MKSVTIVLPHPPQILRSNGSHGGHHARNRAAQAYKAQARLLSIQAFARQPAPRWRQARLLITWRSRTKIHPDPTNLVGMLKHAIDGMEAAGVIENDRGLWPERPRIEMGASWSEVVLTVEEDTE